MNTLRFADDQVIIDEIIERRIHITKNSKMEISLENSEAMAFLGQDQITCKIIVDNKCLQVKKFKHLVCETSYEKGKEKDIQQNPAKCS
jgi:hypothetical protein